MDLQSLLIDGNYSQFLDSQYGHHNLIDTIGTNPVGHKLILSAPFNEKELLNLIPATKYAECAIMHKIYFNSNGHYHIPIPGQIFYKSYLALFRDLYLNNFTFNGNESADDIYLIYHFAAAFNMVQFMLNNYKSHAKHPQLQSASPTRELSLPQLITRYAILKDSMLIAQLVIKGSNWPAFMTAFISRPIPNIATLLTQEMLINVANFYLHNIKHMVSKYFILNIQSARHCPYLIECLNKKDTNEYESYSTIVQI